ncbi:MAG: NAD(P)/FAD-dependent oxidoreductase [Burkholderiaceae bacterium]|nr:NAD(P)/FAD-dependent oxidoreductase [Microbacteriaceae bacterium]
MRDLLVVGGGPVGLAAAIDARLRGLTVAVIEPRGGDAIDKACGEGLMPGAVPALARLGVFPAGQPLRGVRYSNGSRSVDHRFRAGNGMGVRRTELSAVLAERALELGVERVTGRVDTVEQTDSAVTAGGVTARYLLGADGLHSVVRRLTGLDPAPTTGTRRYGVRRHYAIAPWSDLIEVHWTPEVEAYVTPVSVDTVGVAMLGERGISFEAQLARIPELAARVAGAATASTLRGAGPFHQRVTRRTAGRIMLVGDAAGYVDAITGEGIRVGLAQAEAAVDCVVGSRPGDYEGEWRRRTRESRSLTTALVAAARSPLRDRIVPLAVAAPRLFGAVVERLAR